jgi:formylglycine-generating enzyme required for sulfatase activity
MPVTDIGCENLIADLSSAREESDRLFAVLKADALYERPIAERHRVIFYVGHLDGFDSIQICREALGIKSEHATFDSLFQAGIDPDSAHLPSDKPSDWPSLKDIEAYVQKCRRRVDEHLAHAPHDAVEMALEHRLMHLETLAYMFHNFSYEHKVRGVRQNERRRQTLGVCKNQWLEIPAGNATLGKTADGIFGWDNEYGKITRYVPGFLIQKFKVTNREYLEFVNEGAKPPNFWLRKGNDWLYKGMFEEIPLPLDWPVYVTQREAESYARWIGAELPSEEQYQRAAYGTQSGAQNAFPWGAAVADETRGNFDFWRWDPEPVHSTPLGDSAFGVSQTVGNGWEWTSSAFGPFPGFAPNPNYPGYSANFFDGEHYVTKGGSSRTGARLLRNSFRNWFRRDYPYTYTGFRCVRNV